MNKYFLKTIISLSLILILSSTSLAQNLILKNEQESSEISYELKHPAHDTRATSKNIEVKIEYDTTKNIILNAIAQVKVNTFNSGNSNRDSHALELIEALKYPFAKFRSNKIVDKGDTIIVYGDLNFHGVTKNITIKATKKIYNQKLLINGGFSISLDQFNVERPKLLFVPTEEYLKFDFKLSFLIKQ